MKSLRTLKVKAFTLIEMLVVFAHYQRSSLALCSELDQAERFGNRYRKSSSRQSRGEPG